MFFNPDSFKVGTMRALRVKAQLFPIPTHRLPEASMRGMPGDTRACFAEYHRCHDLFTSIKDIGLCFNKALREYEE